MPRIGVHRRVLAHPHTALVIAFATWKTLLLLVAFASPGPGYDTSTTLLLGQDAAASTLVTASVPWTATLGEYLASKLTRWDAIYFTSAAERGYQYEQEWAFSWAFSRSIAHLVKFFPFANRSLAAHVWAGVIVSNLSHLLSILVLYRLVVLIFPGPARSKTAFLTAATHLLSPAGMFLVAPYAEAPFSLLNFLGMLYYAYACSDGAPLRLTKIDRERKFPPYPLCLLLSGICFGLATAMRSNGILSGLIFLYDVLRSLPGLRGSQSEQLYSFMRILSTSMAGILVAAGFVIPQWVAYQQYCVEETARPWCSNTLPSIYSWVQQHYWSVGFLRYWTLSNVPLFLLATPMLSIMITSALRVIRRCSGLFLSDPGPAEQLSTEGSSSKAETPHLLVAFGLPQFALAALAATNFHVQIANRISSGYPLWYLTIAFGLENTEKQQMIAIASKDASKSIFRLIVMYALVQGALFASFLPPA